MESDSSKRMIQAQKQTDMSWPMHPLARATGSGEGTRASSSGSGDTSPVATMCRWVTPVPVWARGGNNCQRLNIPLRRKEQPNEPHFTAQRGAQTGGAGGAQCHRRSPTRVHTSELLRTPRNNRPEPVQLCGFSHTVEMPIYLGIICFLPWSSLYSEQLLSFNKPLVKAFSLL